jgi:S1-C subfamily serine protease
MVRPKVAALLGICVALALTGSAAARGGTPGGKLAARQPTGREQELAPEVRSRIRQASVAVGLILVRNSDEPDGAAPRPRGSAVVVRADGIVVTNYHVITEGRSGRLYDEIFFNLAAEGAVNPAAPDHHRLRALVINKEHDLALLRIEPRQAEGAPSAPTLFPALEFGDSQRAQPLDDLFIIGFPEKGGLSITINRGVVEGKDILGNWIKTDARVIHGNSGGAAVNGEGKLIGIPTKVVADSQAIDKDGDGFPDASRTYGAVGFLRPAHLIAEMLAQVDGKAPKRAIQPDRPQVLSATATVTVRGTVKSARDKKPVAGALVGIIPQGEKAVSEANLLTWGGSNGDGQFVLKRPLPPGRYTLKVKALGYELLTRDVEISQNSARLALELIPTSRQ